MKKLWLSLLVLFLNSYLGFSQQFAIDTVYFEFDRADLTSTFQEELDSLVAKFSSYPSYYVEITGHTDSIGSETYNMQLSEKRALSVYSYLVGKGLHPKRMSYEGFGTQRPVAPNTSFLGRMKNRRADMAVIFSSDTLDQPVAEVDSSEFTPVVEEPKIDPEIPVEQEAGYDAITFDPRRANVITGPEGTRVTIPPNIFETNDAELSFRIREMFSRQDIILANMPSIDRNGPLETAGMVQVDITNARRRPVRMKRGMAFKVEVPTTRRDQYMSVYRGTGGSRGARRGGQEPAISPVSQWQEEANVAVGYAGNMYEFQAPSLSRFTVARPLHFSQNTDEKAAPIDFSVKLKGKRFERTTSVMLIGKSIRTFIPLKKRSTRLYEGDGIKYLDKDTELILVAIQYDNDGIPYFTKRDIRVGNFLKEGRKGNGTVKVKSKFRRLKDYDDLVEKLNEL